VGITPQKLHGVSPYLHPIHRLNVLSHILLCHPAPTSHLLHTTGAAAVAPQKPVRIIAEVSVIPQDVNTVFL
jgi:hypothetical protein